MFPLHEAVFKDDPVALKECIESKQHDIDAFDSNGGSFMLDLPCLHVSMEICASCLAKALRSANDRSDVCSFFPGHTPLTLAAVLNRKGL